MSKLHRLSAALLLSSLAACRGGGGPADPDAGTRPDAEPDPVCGNMVVEGPEECDDGNSEPLDGCEPDCTLTPDVLECKTLAPLPAGTCERTAGDGRTLLVGDVLAPGLVLAGGEVLIEADGTISCVGCDCATAGATVITCPTGVISPGLINTHDHITFTHSPPYTDAGERYEHRHDWRLGLRGHTRVTATGGASPDQVRWGELRFLLGGATSTVGSGSASGFLRNLDRASDQEGLGQPAVHFETFPLGDSDGTLRSSGCTYPDIDTTASIANDDAYFPHIAEGIDDEARNEFVCTSQTASGGQDLLEPQSAYIHAIGLYPTDYALMADQRTSLIWSPRSNITLYGDTAQVTTAARLGVLIALGTDWLPTGSMNLLRELRCAADYNRDYLDGFFSHRDLWKMVTINAARAAAVDDAVGSLAPGLTADITVFDGAAAGDGYQAVLDATPREVVLVLRGGKPLYGDDSLLDAACDPLDVCGRAKRVCAQSEIGKSLSALQSSVGGIYPAFFCGTPQNEPSCVPRRPMSVDGSTTYTGSPAPTDMDGDGIPDNSDNCPTVFNPIRPVDFGVQGDFDLDGEGDACDPCPLDASTSECTAIDPDDQDGDGVADAGDNCPGRANPGQEDRDADGKGDACDPCPDDANPGSDGCPASIYDIKQGTATGNVAVLGALVTGCRDSRGFFLQVKPEDPGYLGADHSGIFVFHPSTACGTTVTVGDRVDLPSATVNDYFGQIQLSFATVVVKSSGEASPAPVVVTPAAAGGTAPTSLESVIVRVENVTVTDDAPPPGPGDTLPTGEFVVDDALRVNDFLYAITPVPPVGTVYTSVTGILSYRNGHSKLEPRSAADVVLGPPQLTELGPSPSFVREGQVAVTTIPDPLQVRLTGPATAPTFVAVTSSDPAKLSVVGGGVTVPMGATSADVVVNGLVQAASVTLTANYDGVMRSAAVRVLGAAETPAVSDLAPTAALVPPGGTVTLTVTLDIPAPAGGSTVTLSTTPGTAGSVPASVVVPADALSAAFDFTATGGAGTETVTAELGGGMASATITVDTGGLILNEVDYDQPGTDTDEFIEILNTSAATIDLTGHSLVLINGSGGTQYGVIDLAAAGTLAPGEYLVVGSAALLSSVPPGTKTIAFGAATNNIQNGAPDAIALRSGGMLLDALSYEGSVTGYVEGTPTPAVDTGDGSLSRIPNGADTDDAAADWAFTTTPTPGSPNLP